MIKPVVPYDRFLSIFMPGGVFVVAVWYLHRPFLLKYFPYIASEVGEGGATGGIKTLIFIIAATCFGIFINYFADIAVVAIVYDDAESKKAERKARRFLRTIYRIFSIKVEPDPRTNAILRYLDSDKKEQFIKMMEDWTWTNEEKLRNPNGAILAHQHIMSRMNALSDRSRNVVQEIYMHNVLFPASLFTVTSFLLPITLASFFTSYIVGTEEIKVHPTHVLIVLCFLVYCFGVITAYSVKRRFKHFCSHLITIALHFYYQDNKDSNR